MASFINTLKAQFQGHNSAHILSNSYQGLPCCAFLQDGWRHACSLCEPCNEACLPHSRAALQEDGLFQLQSPEHTHGIAGHCGGAKVKLMTPQPCANHLVTLNPQRGYAPALRVVNVCRKLSLMIRVLEICCMKIFIPPIDNLNKPLLDPKFNHPV